MGKVLLAQVDHETTALLSGEDRAVDVVIEQVPSGEDAADYVASRAADVETVVLGADLKEPLRIAQRLQAADRELAVLILSEPERAQLLTRAVQFAPYLSNEVRCCAVDSGTALCETVQQAVTGTRQRRKHRATLAALHSDMQSWQVPQRISNLYLERLLEYAPIAVVALDGEGRIQAWNRQATRIFGRGEREALGESLAEMFPGHEQDELRRFMKESLAATGDLVPQILRLQRPGGDALFVEGSAASLAGRSGESGALVIFQDVTQRVKAELALQESLDTLEEKVQQRTAELEQSYAALEKSNIELQQFAYVASHDLQEPLRMVASFCQLLKRDYQEQLDETALEYIDYAVNGAKRLQDLIRDLLTYSRIEAEMGPLASVDCKSLVRGALMDLEGSMNEAAATVHVGELPTVQAGAPQLGQVFRNLIGNAIKYRSQEPCRVEITARCEGDEWVFAVRDNGIGISPEHVQRVFEMFKRLHSRAKYPGTGIGLAICKRVVEHLGGRIWAESQPDQGTTFYFTLPAMEAREA